MRVFLGFFVVILLAVTASAREIHVNNVAGDDTFTGHGQQNLRDGSGPLRTIGRALQLAHSGDRIVLTKTDEPYRESISLVGIRHSGNSQRPFTIEGNGAVLDGSETVPSEAWKHHEGPVFRFRPRRMGSQQVFLENRPAVRVIADHQAAGPPKLKPLEWCTYRGEIFFCVEPDKRPEDYAVSFAVRQTGVTLFHVDSVVLLDLTVQGFRIDGINAANSARRVYLGGVTARGNGRAGIAVGGASRVELEGSLVGNNGQAQLLTLPYSETTVHGSELYSNPAPAWLDRGGSLSVDGQSVEGGIDGRDVLPDGNSKD